MFLFAFIFGIFFENIRGFGIFLPVFMVFGWKKFWIYLCCMGLGMGYYQVHVWFTRPFPEIHQNVVGMTGKILSFKQSHTHFDKYLVQVDTINQQPARLQLWLYLKIGAQELYPGEVWHWKGKLYPEPRWFNPGVNTVWQYMQNYHIQGRGFVMSELHRLRQIPRYAWITRIRYRIYRLAYQHIQDEFSRALFLTLILGLGTELSQDQWQIFRLTGTAHLMVVSGAHLALVMLLISYLVRLCTFCFPSLLVVVPQRRLACALSLLLGLLYALLSGFGFSIQRAWLMFLFSWLRYFGSYRVNMWQSLRWSLAIIVLIEPHALWSPAIYLSYLAVAILLFAAQFSWRHVWLKAVVLQFFCLFGLAPLSVLWFKNLAISGLIANFFAIPFLSYCVLPCAFLVLVSLLCGFQNFVLQGFAHLTFVLQHGLTLLSQCTMLNVQGEWLHARDPWILLLMGFIVLNFPVFRIFLAALGLVCILLYPHRSLIKYGEFWADVLDIGQGLAVMVRTQKHNLLFDTGGKKGQVTLAELVIWPYLKHEGIKLLNKVVISHPDEDHVAGLEDIFLHSPLAQLIVDRPEQYQRALSCQKFPNWCWDGVCFHFIRYQVPIRANKNNHSCVLQVMNQHYQLLLTGDIEKLAEYSILQSYRSRMRSSVLLVPHHGSQTSSTYWFLSMVQPELAVISVGRHNSYHLPHYKVMERYQWFHIPLVTTAEVGMVRIMMHLRSWNLVLWRMRNWYQFWFY